MQNRLDLGPRTGSTHAMSTLSSTAGPSAPPQPHPQFPLLFSPFAIGALKLRNRIVMLPHGTSMVMNGAPTEDDSAYYTMGAGAGLIITGAAVTSPDSTRRGRKLVEIYSDHVLPALARRAAAVHAHG